ncbi:hypothetical protein DSM25558_5121 [Agrobacterium sp. DSM 25558]|uniref:hypothetical protein n=1 Tax=Agrobacterium sp. DSM 25558 TaxID=1907665 RepID=UPI0009725EAE|nr:hypothetical protein [Agrobacterium sp. DSM 25558]SCX31105.1 hypothetical protein DSM25558_5121 [Agrobacterium sp. DSM 25558]
MAKTAYFAIDPNGKTHTRNTERSYSHTVVYRQDKAEKLAFAMHKDWHKTDGRNYDYDALCAAGTHAHVTTVTPASGFHASYTAEQIAARQEAQREENADRIAKAKASIGTMTRAEFIADQQARRVASAEKADYTTYFNAGWCGRLDLAQKLAAKFAGSTILPASAR